MGTTAAFASTPNTDGASFVNADGTSDKTLWTAGASGGLIENIFITSDDTTARTLILKLTYGGNTRPLGAIAIPALGGATLMQVNGLDPDVIYALSITDPKLVLEAGVLLKASMVVAVTSAKTVSVTVLGGDF